MSQALSNLAVGSKVKFGSYSVNGEAAQPIVWTIVAKNHTGYPDNSVTLHTSKIIDIRCIDEKEPNNSNSDRQEYGNSRYSVSNLDQWLNKDSAAGKWYVAAHDADQAPDLDSTVERKRPYAERPGFLNAFTQVEKDAILSTTIQATGQNIDNSQYETIERKVFLPSYTEIGLSNTYAPIEGSTWGYYTDNASRVAYLTQQSFDAIPGYVSTITSPIYWWLRTVIYDDIHYGSTLISSTGESSYTTPISPYGIRPALNLSNTLKVSDTTDSDGCYTFTWPSHPMPWVGGTETYTENIQVQRAVGMQDNSSTLTEDRQDEFWEDKYYYEGSSTANSDGFHLQFSNNDIEGMCFLSRHFTTDKVGTTITSKITFLKAFNNVEISKIDWRNDTSGVDTTTETCTIKLNDTSVYTISATKEQYGTYTASIATGILIGDVSAGDVISFVDNKSGTISSTSAYRDLVGGLRFYFSSDPSVFTETVSVQKTRGVNKPVSSIYAGVIATVPVYTETTTTEDIALSSATFTDFFSADNTGTTGTNAKGITWTDNSGGGLKLTFGNYGINSSTSMTTFTAQRDLTNVVIKGLYYTESRFDKITLTVAGTTVLNAVSGTSSTLTQRWSGSLSKGQTIVLKFVKDSSQSASNEKSTYFTLSCDPYQKTTVDKVQTGTETKLVDKKIVKGYVGGPDGKARLFFGANGLIASFDGAYTSEMIDVDGTSYELCTLTSSGILQLNSAANVWICGGGATGATNSPAGGCGGNIAQTILENTSATYYINVGPADAATIITSNGDTILSASAGTTTSGGCGRGGYRGYSQNIAPVSNSATDTHPYGIQTLDPTCAGGGSGSTYQTGNYWYQAGNGGSSGVAATSASYVLKDSVRAAVGGVRGGGNGAAPDKTSNGYSPNNGSNASYYGAGGGGCGVNYASSTSPRYKGKPGSGYQGVVFLFGKLDAKAHQHVKGTEYTITKQATCTATGIKTYKCTECGEDAFTETIPATGHMWSEYTDSDGVTWDKCIKCGLMVRPSS